MWSTGHGQKVLNAPIERKRDLKTLVAFVSKRVIASAVDDEHHLDDGEHQRQTDDNQRKDGGRERFVPVGNQHAKQKPDDDGVRREEVAAGSVEVEILQCKVDYQIHDEYGETDGSGADVI